MREMSDIVEYLEKRRQRTIAIESIISAARSLETWLHAPQGDACNREIVVDCRAELRVCVLRLEQLK